MEIGCYYTISGEQTPTHSSLRTKKRQWDRQTGITGEQAYYLVLGQEAGTFSGGSQLVVTL